MLQTFRKDAERECLDTRGGLVARFTIGKDTRQIANFRHPAAVLFKLEFDREAHRRQS